jgi:hypothetical protein
MGNMVVACSTVEYMSLLTSMHITGGEGACHSYMSYWLCGFRTPLVIVTGGSILMVYWEHTRFYDVHY